MIIKQEVNPSDFNFWGAAEYTINRVREENKENDFDAFIEEYFPNGTDATALNDFVAFDRDYIFDVLGISEE